MAVVTLEELLDPKRAQREEGWHNFAQSYERSMATLSESIEKLSGKRKLGEGESAFTVLEAYAKAQREKGEAEAEKSQRLHDLVSASIPQVTEAQMDAYKAQKDLYDSYQEEIKKQTRAVEKAAQSQIDAVDREQKEKLTALNAEVAKAKRYEGGGDLTKFAQALMEGGASASKIAGSDTIVTKLFESVKGALGESQKMRDARIDEIADMRRKEIQVETEERKKAIKDETAARIQAIKEEVTARADLEGAAKAPISPVEIRKQAVEATESAILKNPKAMAVAAASPLAVPAQQEFLRDELRQEATEELIKREGGLAMAPVIEEGEILPKEAPKPEPKQESKPKAEKTEAVSNEKVSDIVETVARGKEAASAVATKGVGLLGTLGPMVASVGAMAASAGIAAKALQDVDKTLPLVSTGIAALGDGSRLIGPAIVTLGLELGGYILEGANGLAETIQSAISVRDTRQERVAEAIQKERVIQESKRASDEARMESIRGTSALSKGYNLGGARIERISASYTTPVEEEQMRQPPVQANGQDDSLSKAVAAMLEAETRAADRQARLGQGTTPLMMTNPSLEPFPV